ncbi:MAG TPA: OsmC family protein [Polyangiales bacterium]|nr:OsmC family protein [Polyangiales bacterium]
MTTHVARVVWQAGDVTHKEPTYSRGHVWQFDGGLSVFASASPQRVQTPMSNEAAVDPEEAFVASISSCHMLWFLDFAHRAGLEVGRYVDDASGTLAADGRGHWAMREVLLRPRIDWVGRTPAPEEVDALHHRAHAACFLANSVNFPVRVQ